MENRNFEDYKKDRYQKEIEWYDKKSINNKRIYSVFQWGLIILSSITPLVVALEGNSDKKFIWLPISTSILVAFLASGLKVFKFQEKWVNYRTLCETLKKEIHFYQADLYDYQDSNDKEATFVQRVESLISRENNLWINMTKEEKKNEKK